MSSEIETTDAAGAGSDQAALECPMCGAKDAFTIDPEDGSKGFCASEGVTWEIGESLQLQALRLCWAIEKLPASKEQTDVSLLASRLLSRIQAEAEAAARCKTCDGTGEVMYEYGSPVDTEPTQVTEPCPDCGGNFP
jgi:phage/plasmid primase-like uncharacterized protein